MKSYTHKFTSKIDTYLLEDVSHEQTYTIEEMKDLYQTMLSIRKMEEISQTLYDEKKIRGFCHLVSGQESIYAAYKYASDKRDTATSSYRCHGLSYVTGDSSSTIFLELLGREGGMCKGKGGSMHLYNERFYGGHGIVGAQVPISLGLAFKHKYVELKKNDKLEKMIAKNASFAFYGDGAANQGQVFESINMALLWKLPIVFVCENNGYGMWTKVDDVSGNSDFYKRLNGIPGIRIRHENVFDMIAVFKICRDFVLKKSPMVLEILTYRLCTHSARDGKDFRSEKELDNRNEIDPIKKFRSFLSEYISEEELVTIEKHINERIEKDAKMAESGKEPDPSALFTNVLID